MFDKFIRGIKSMELEDQIFHVGVLICTVSIFLPWFGEQGIDRQQTWNGFFYYTGYIGRVVFLAQLYLLTVTLSPLLGGPVLVKAGVRRYMRFLLSAVCTMLLISALSVLMRVTYEIAGTDMRFGIYVSLVSSSIATLYAFLRYHEQQKLHQQELFKHPDEQVVQRQMVDAELAPHVPVPPPPPPLPPEEHHPFSR